MSATPSPMRWWVLPLSTGIALAACDLGAKPERQIVTQVRALAPAAPGVKLAKAADRQRSADEERAAFERDDVPERPPVTACSDVEHKARALAAELPRQLDPDTRATAVSAKGCDLRFDYELSTLSARDVSERGMRAMRRQVLDRLCNDKGALAVMQRGGRITNVYTDREHEPIGLFTVAADDCGI